MKKSQKLQYFKAVIISEDRGKFKSCMLCNKDFGMLVKEHQCKRYIYIIPNLIIKRCKRAVCEKCSPNKAIALKYDVAPKKPHR